MLKKMHIGKEKQIIQISKYLKMKGKSSLQWSVLIVGFKQRKDFQNNSSKQDNNFKKWKLNFSISFKAHI